MVVDMMNVLIELGDNVVFVVSEVDFFIIVV